MTSHNSPHPKLQEEPYEPFRYLTSSKVMLPPPKDMPKKEFFEVLLSRRSKRSFANLSISETANVLWHSSKVMEVEILESGFLWSHRPSPSAGGRHPIDVLISLPEENQPRTISFYNPLDHSLNTLIVNSASLEALFAHTAEILPIERATILWFLAHPKRTSSKYDNHESLVWRDAGALAYCIQIVCQVLNINCCPLGSLGEPYLSNLFGEDLYGVGGCLLG